MKFGGQATYGPKKSWSKFGTCSGYSGYRNFPSPATAGPHVERHHRARPRLYWYNGQCNINLLRLHDRTCRPPVTTLCQFQCGVHGGDMRSTECPLAYVSAPWIVCWQTQSKYCINVSVLISRKLLVKQMHFLFAFSDKRMECSFSACQYLYRSDSVYSEQKW